MNDLTVFAGNSNPYLAERISKYLGKPLGNAKVTTFSDGEVQIEICENVRGRDVYILQSTCCPVNDNLMELLLMIDAVKRSAARKITAVIPYFGYARQDRKTKARDPISGKLVSNLFEKTGAHRVISADLHAGQIQGFFDIPVDHLTGIPLLASYFKDVFHEEIENDNLVVVAPDVGGVVRARRFAVLLSSDLAIVDKRRSHEVANYCEVMDIIGEIEGKTVVLVDDIIDTAGTIVNAASALKERGAVRVCACATHGVLSGPAIERLSSHSIDSVVLTDTIPLPESKKLDKIVQLSIAPLFAESIRRVHTDRSVSSLFKR